MRLFAVMPMMPVLASPMRGGDRERVVLCGEAGAVDLREMVLRREARLADVLKMVLRWAARLAGLREMVLRWAARLVGVRTMVVRWAGRLVDVCKMVLRWAARLVGVLKMVFGRPPQRAPGQRAAVVGGCQKAFFGLGLAVEMLPKAVGQLWRAIGMEQKERPLASKNPAPSERVLLIALATIASQRMSRMLYFQPKNGELFLLLPWDTLPQ